MVFDWFRRKAAPPAPAAPPPEPTEVPAEEPAQKPEVAAPPPPEPTPALPEPATSPSVPAPTPAVAAGAGVDEDALAWARQAYARLRTQQEAAQAAAPPPDAAAPAPAAPSEPASVPEPAPVAAAPSLLEQAAAQRRQRLEQITAPAPPAPAEPQAVAAPPAVETDAADPRLGAFDANFTWSAEVLAAQGRQADQVSLEEIDWLGRLRRGLEKTRRGFVTQLLENLGDDPLTPEVLEDLECTLLRADVGVKATDQVLDALRQRLNEEVVDPAEGLRFLKEQLPRPARGADLRADRPPAGAAAGSAQRLAAGRGERGRQDHHPGQAGQPGGAQRLQLPDRRRRHLPRRCGPAGLGLG